MKKSMTLAAALFSLSAYAMPPPLAIAILPVLLASTADTSAPSAPANSCQSKFEACMAAQRAPEAEKPLPAPTYTAPTAPSAVRVSPSLTPEREQAIKQRYGSKLLERN